jgi:phage terminase small subunit
MATRHRRRRGYWAASAAAAPPALEDVEACAARLGITPERVLREYARIAFADLRDIAGWGPDGLEIKPSSELTPAAAAAIADIVAAAATGKVYRIKLHDKKPVLDAMARHLGMLPELGPAAVEDEPTQDEAKSARERLILELDRLAAEGAPGSGDPEAQR